MDSLSFAKLNTFYIGATYVIQNQALIPKGCGCGHRWKVAIGKDPTFDLSADSSNKTRNLMRVFYTDNNLTIY